MQNDFFEILYAEWQEEFKYMFFYSPSLLMGQLESIC